MSPRHLVVRGAAAEYRKPAGWAAAAEGYRRWDVVGEETGSAHTGFAIGCLEPGGSLPAHVHSFEESFYVLDGVGVIDLPDGAYQVGSGDYGLIPVGTAHAWRNLGSTPVSWAEMAGPAPRQRYGDDTFAVSLGRGDPVPINVR